MADNIFRKKSIDKINSPEDLNNYLKVTNPSVWLILIGIVILLIGAFVYGAIGKVDTRVNAVAEVSNGTIKAYIDESSKDSVSDGMAIRIDGADYTIKSIADRPLKSSEVDEYVLHTGNMDNSQWVYPVTVDGGLKDGVYPATITVERISPISYVFN